MKRATGIVNLVIAALLAIGAPKAWAESAVPDPAAFFGGLVNPQAQGAKLSGFLTIAYDFVEDFELCSGVKINNMFVVTTLQFREQIKPFNRDFIAPDGTVLLEPFCFDDLQTQINFVLGLYKEEVIPHFFQCVPEATCPTFEVKSMKSFLSSGTGAVSTKVRLAVKVAGEGDDSDD